MWLIRQFILRFLNRERLRCAVTVVGISLGIAVVIAIQLSNASAINGFAAAIEAISGKTSLEIIGPAIGFDETRLLEMGWLRRYGELSPVIEGEAMATLAGNKGEWLKVLGVDILHDRSFRDYRLVEFEERNRIPSMREFLKLLIDPASIILTRRFAARHGLTVGSTLELTTADTARTYVVRGLLLDEGPARALDGNFALMDIASAQLAFQRLGRIDRLELLIPRNPSSQAVQTEVSRRLPADLRIQTPSQRSRQVEKMLEAFRFNLSALSHISLLVGLFLIYNTVSISVVARRQEIGTLRAIGVRRATVLRLFLSEAAVMSILGCAIGLVLGRGLAYGAIRVTFTTLNALYIAAAAQPAPIEIQQVLLAFAIGVPLSLLAAAVPAYDAASVPPTAAIRGSERVERRFFLKHQHYLLPNLLFLLALGLSSLKPIWNQPVFGYLAAVAAVFGAAFLVPVILHFLSRTGAKPLDRIFRVEGWLANANLAGAIRRISISVAALAVSLSMMVAIAVMIHSFRETVIYWVSQTLNADLYVRPVTRANITIQATISAEAEKIVRGHPSVAAVGGFRNFDVLFEGRLVTVGAGEFATLLKHGNLLFKSPSDPRGAMQAAIGKEAVVVSESFALKHGRRVGDWVRLATPQGLVAFRVVAVYYDYSSDRGVVVMDRTVFTRYFGEQRPTSLAVYLVPGSDPERVREGILAELCPQYRLFVYTNVSLRKEVLRIFDNTFLIAYALEIVAILIAILGVASTLLTLILERRQEFRILRQLGAGHRQISKMVIIEALLLGGVSQFLGIAVGVLLSLILIYVINVQSFGWTIQFRFPLGFILQSTILILAAAALSGYYPAKRACQLSQAEQMEAE